MSCCFERQKAVSIVNACQKTSYSSKKKLNKK